ncbi:MAG: DNA repair protein RecO [Mariprofundaceae bacterium]|nr:DNA repair protein RecO [Mariprofundaceae bacterium]
MAELQDSAWLLRRVAYGDTSYIIHFLGRTQGRFTLMARGARRPKSPFRASLEPLHALQLTWRAGRTGMGTLTDVERGEMCMDMSRSFEGLQLCAVAAQLFRDGDPHGFDELQRAFSLLAGRQPDIGLLAGVWQLLSDSGLIGPLDHCWQCANAATDLGWQNAELHCLDCGGGDVVSVGLRRAIAALMHSATVRMSVRDLTMWQAMIQDVLRRHGLKPMNACR